MKKGLVCLVLGVAVLLMTPAAPAQDHGSGGGGGCGDVFGDLIHILRHETTGQPILQKRWVELPMDVPGYGWGYCPVAVDASGAELAFAPLSCDVAEEDLARVVKVDYFGRLNGGRTKERNNRMHFNEVLSSIKDADLVKQGPAGRLTLGYDCGRKQDGAPSPPCAEWSDVDSPMESMGLFSRVMKYGHFQTNPMEPDEWHHGDPKLPQQYQPALGPEDYRKFHQSVRHLLPNDGAGDPWDCFSDVNDNDEWDPTEPFTDLEDSAPGYDIGDPFMDINANGIRDEGGDTFLCGDDGPDPADPRHDVSRERLDSEDFSRAGVFLGAAANKFGRSTRDLVQYFGRIMKLTKNTPHTLATLDTLPALVRDCAVGEVPGPDLDHDLQFEPTYDMADCNVIDAPVGDDPDKIFTDLHERFVDFAAAEYERLDWRNEQVEVIQPGGDESWAEGEVYLMDWLAYANGSATPQANIDAFVKATGDTIRSIQFIHNYRIPEHLWDAEP